jgi:hypothetical protein
MNEGNDFRAHNSALADSNDSYFTYLHDVCEKHGESHATRFVREKNEVGIREEEKGCNGLPSHLTKRKLFELSVWGGGW